MKDVLRECNLKGLVLEDAVWTVVTPTNQRLLDQCGVGTVHSSEQSVQYIAHTLNTPSQATVCVLLSLLEALYYFEEIQIFESTPEGLKQVTRPVLQSLRMVSFVESCFRSLRSIVRSISEASGPCFVHLYISRIR